MKKRGSVDHRIDADSQLRALSLALRPKPTNSNGHVQTAISTIGERRCSDLYN